MYVRSKKKNKNLYVCFFTSLDRPNVYDLQQISWNYFYVLFYCFQNMVVSFLRRIQRGGEQRTNLHEWELWTKLKSKIIYIVSLPRPKTLVPNPLQALANGCSPSGFDNYDLDRFFDNLLLETKWLQQMSSMVEASL